MGVRDKGGLKLRRRQVDALRQHILIKQSKLVGVLFHGAVEICHRARGEEGGEY